MTAQHKHSGLCLEASTQLGQQEIAAFAEQAADATRSRLERSTPGRLDYSVHNWLKNTVMDRELMTFSLRASVQGSRTTVTTNITSFKTTQPRIRILFFLIPTGPKQLLGLTVYRKFIDQIRGLILANDASARAAILGDS